jgi:hypothetical protein
MARYDKYEPKAGGFRAPLAGAWAASEKGKPYAVGLNSSGQVVKGAGNTGILGVLIVNQAQAAGDIVDVMTHGEIVEMTLSDGITALTAGTVYYGVPADGTLSVTATANKKVGHTVEAGRMVVRVAPTGTGA